MKQIIIEIKSIFKTNITKLNLEIRETIEKLNNLIYDLYEINNEELTNLKNC